jgi:enoyl-CoA hydratase/carnithine racemase
MCGDPSARESRDGNHRQDGDRGGSVTGLKVAQGDDGIAVFTLDRPQALNALDTALRVALAEAFAVAARDDRVACVIMTGAGERGFCAGQDVKESAALGRDAGPRFMESWKAYFRALSTFPKPIVQAINGVAAGGGFETVLMGDAKLCVPDARFIMAEVDIGLPAVVGGFLLQTQLGLSRATEMTLSGRTMYAEEARHVGLVQEIAPRAQLLARARARAAELAAKPPVARALTLAKFRENFRRGLAVAETASTAYQTEALATGEPQRVMQLFLEKRRGARDAAPSTGIRRRDDHMGQFSKLDQDGDVAIITLNRPEVMNAWHSAMRTEVTGVIERLNADASVKAIIMTGAGDKAFCAGQDLNETKTFDAARSATWIEEWRRMYGAIRKLDKPLVIALNGVAAGSAFQVALLGDVRIGHPGVRMGQPEINSGIASTLGPWIMKEMIGLSRTIELTLSGRMMDAAECHHIGLIHRLVPPGEVMSTALATARLLAAKPPVAMRLNKRRFREVTEAGFNDALDSGIAIQKESYGSGEPQRYMEKFLAERAKKRPA